MPYTTLWNNVDAISTHMKDSVIQTTPHELQKMYAGFLVISCVSAYETAIKKIALDYSQNHSQILHAYVSADYNKINAKISIEDLQKHLSKFGVMFSKSFKDLVDYEASICFANDRKDLKNIYKNLMEWRNQAAHTGQLNSDVTLGEVIESHPYGKTIIDCFYVALTST